MSIKVFVFKFQDVFLLLNEKFLMPDLIIRQSDTSRVIAALQLQRLCRNVGVFNLISGRSFLSAYFQFHYNVVDICHVFKLYFS